MELAHNSSSSGGVQHASSMLRDELLAPEAQKIWAKYLPDSIAQGSAPVISYRAIARAIAADQYRRYGIEESPSRYKDRVRRAVIGQRITVDTLELLAETFNFSDQARQEISKCISAEEIRRDSHKIENRNHFITPTSTFYDIYFDKNLRAFKIESTMVVRAVADEVTEIWAKHGEDIDRIELLEGGVSEWDEDRGAWKFTLVYPLAAHESIMIRYVTHINTSVKQEGYISLNYGTTRQACFYRLFFDDPTVSPEAIKVTRRFPSASFSPFGTETKEYTVPAYGNRASFYLDNVYKETLIFSEGLLADIDPNES